MNVASLYLCKELYELSGWDEPMSTHYDTTDGSLAVGIDRTAMPGGVDIPAYALGYLLRKLPRHIYGGQYFSLENVLQDGWGAGYQEYGEYDSYYNDADTPEDAVAKVVIELFKQGVLTREETV